MTEIIDPEQFDKFLKETGLDRFDPRNGSFDLNEVQNTDIIEGLREKNITPLLDMYCALLKNFKDSGSSNDGSNNDGIVNCIDNISKLIEKINNAVTENGNNKLEIDKEFLNDLSKFYIENNNLKNRDSNVKEDYIDNMYNNMIQNRHSNLKDTSTNVDFTSFLNNIKQNTKPLLDFLTKLEKNSQEIETNKPPLPSHNPKKTYNEKEDNYNEKEDNQQNSVQNKQNAIEPSKNSSELKQKTSEIPIIADLLILGTAIGSYSIATAVAPVFTPVYLLAMLYFLYKYLPKMGKVFKYNSNYIDNSPSNYLGNSTNQSQNKPVLPAINLDNSFDKSGKIPGLPATNLDNSANKFKSNSNDTPIPSLDNSVANKSGNKKTNIPLLFSVTYGENKLNELSEKLRDAKIGFYLSNELNEIINSQNPDSNLEKIEIKGVYNDDKDIEVFKTDDILNLLNGKSSLENIYKLLKENNGAISIPINSNKNEDKQKIILYSDKEGNLKFLYKNNCKDDNITKIINKDFEALKADLETLKRGKNKLTSISVIIDSSIEEKKSIIDGFKFLKGEEEVENIDKHINFFERDEKNELKEIERC